ncbi:MAG: DsbA family protein [Pseudomonadota bacterium]
MRNLIIAVVAIALAAVAYFAIAARNDAPDAAPATTSIPTEAAVATATETPADEATVSAVADTPAETVEESSGIADASETDVNLTLAQAAPPKPDSKFKPGTHYRELVPTQPTVHSSDKIEVVEVFWYGCGHCFAFDPYVKRWEENVPADVEFVRLPAVWNNTLKKHAAAFYTAEVLEKSGKLKDREAFHDQFFTEIHVNKKQLTTDRALETFFGRFGVSASDYAQAAKSFEVDQKLRTAMDLTRRYKISGVPAIVVNGRYANISQGLGSYEEYIELIDALVEMER